MSPYRLVVFDWDGTLMDSADQIVHCMQRGAEEAGMPVCSPEAIRHIIGLALPEALAELYPGHTTSDHQRVRERYAHHFIRGSGGHAEFFPGVPDLLDELGRQHLLAVATGKNRPGLDRVLERMGMTGFFHATRTADETASKPDPRMLLELMEQLDVAPEQVLMIGDTSYDLEMARNAGVDRVGVTWGVHDESILRRYEPVALVSSINGLASWFRSF